MAKQKGQDPMTYTITTRKPIFPSQRQNPRALMNDSQTTVATLEEASRIVADAEQAQGVSTTARDAEESIHAGRSTFGPLPDGTIIKIVRA